MKDTVKTKLERLEQKIEEKRNELLTGVLIVSSEKEIPPYFRGTAIVDDIS